MRAAEAEGASYFLVPEANYKEAYDAAQKLKVIAIDDIEEAIEFLNTI